MALIFPLNPIEGSTYAGDNGVNYTFQEGKWIGTSIVDIVLSDHLVSGDKTLTLNPDGTVQFPNYKFPAGDGNPDDVLQTDGEGNVDWAIGGGGGPGTTGPTGPNGSQGIQGPAGQQGNQGIAGPIGPTGVQGIQGLAGQQGNPGAAGPIGPTGVQGIQGPVGPQGNQGSQGNQGPTGEQGIQGPQGNQGSQGNQGQIGATGDYGPRGQRGDQGISVTLKGSVTGPSFLPTGGQTAGDAWIDQTEGNLYFWNSTASTWDNIGKIVGPQGDIGEPGPRGQQGELGPTGPQGITGPQGVQGAKGDQGDIGPTGIQGITGPQGNQGAKGDQGDIGPTGIQGITGPQGNQGAKGDQGNIGPTGIQGITGPQGNQGDVGPTGWTGDGFTGPAGNTTWNYRAAWIGTEGYVKYDVVKHNSYLWYNNGSLDNYMGATPGGNDGVWDLVVGGASNTGGNTSGGILDGNGGGDAVSGSTGSWYFSALTFFPSYLTNLDDAVFGVGTDFTGNTHASNLTVIANSAEWKFTHFGTLELPSGGDITLDGVSVLGSGGGGTVWTNDANGCLRVELSSTGFEAFTEESHVDLQNSGTWSIGSYGYATFIGNDEFDNVNILSLRSGDDTYITTNLRENGNHQWKFGTDGNLTFPDGNLTIGSINGQPTIQAADGKSISLISSGSSEDSEVGISLVWFNGFTEQEPIKIAGVVVNNPLYVGEGDVGIVTGGLLGFEGDGNTTNIWNFNADGTTTFPQNKIDAGNNYVIIRSTEYAELEYRNPNAPYAADTVIDAYVGADDSGPYIVNVAKNSDNTDVNIAVWSVDKSGNLVTDIMHEFANNTIGDITDTDGNSLIRAAVSTTAPGNWAKEGHQWYNTEDGRTYIRYANLWVDANPPVIPAVSTYLDGLVIENRTISSADYVDTSVMIGGNLEPDGDLLYNLGSPDRQWNHLYVNSHTIYMGGKALSITDQGLVIDGQTAVYDIDGGSAATWLTA